jgi:hypothetical protein
MDTVHDVGSVLVGLGVVLSLATLLQLWTRAGDPAGATWYDSADLRGRWRGAFAVAAAFFLVGLVLLLIAQFK